MRVYHTSTIAIPHPDICHSRPRLDFGNGFYLTTIREQAERYAERLLKRGETAVLNVYELHEQDETITRKVFETYDEEWLDYVFRCRKGQEHPCYDIVEGGIADDQVFDTIDLFFAGIYTREQALDQLRFKHPNHQLCIASQSVLDDYLVFVEAIPITSL